MTSHSSPRLRLTLGPADVGGRVMVRHVLPAGGATDVLGTLERWDGGRAAVRRADGQVVDVAVGDLLAGHRIPPPPAPRRSAAAYDTLTVEAAAALGWQASACERLGPEPGWLLRASGGFTSRANSVLPLGDPGLPLDDALDAVSRFYRSHGQRARMQVPLPVRADLDAALEARGWTSYDPVVVMVADTARVLSTLPARGDLPTVRVSAELASDWLAAYHYRGAALPPEAATVLTSADLQGFGRVEQDGRVVAVGRVAVAAGWAGLTAMEVVPAARRRGLGAHVVRALVAWAAAQGTRAARHVYLQASEDNATAQALYVHCGFVPHHRYVYRLAPENQR